jgi:hypothetical protein
MYGILKTLGQIVYFGAAFAMVLASLKFTYSTLGFVLALLASVVVLFGLAYVKVVKWEPWLWKKFTE